MSVIEHGLTVIGDIIGEDDLTIKGVVKGTVFLQKGSMALEPEGYVEGEILAENVSIAGELIGKATALKNLRITATASIQGNIQGAKIMIDDGAKFSGKIDIREPEPVELATQEFRTMSEEEYVQLQRWRVRNKLQ